MLELLRQRCGVGCLRKTRLRRGRCGAGKKGQTPVTPDQVKAIQDSFKLVAPISDQAAAMFYGRLFEIAPAVKPLFRGDMTEQGRKLMATLGVVVNSLGNLEAVLPAASALAKRHVDYGVKADDYAPVGAALLWTLEQGLGGNWTPQLAEAWGAAYTLLSNYMIGEAYSRSVAAE
jgi:hemoglobin-like flavoprotein